MTRVGRRRANVFLKESVILFGFLNGLFLAIGVSPGAALFEVLVGVVERLLGSGGPIGVVLTFLPLAFLGVMLYLIWKRGGWLGFVAVGLAFVSGLWLLAAPEAAAVLLLAALGLGFVASR